MVSACALCLSDISLKKGHLVAQMPLWPYTNKVKIKMQIAVSLVFLILALGGIVAVFYVSWFWRALLIPMVVILLWDVVSGVLRKKS